MSGTSKQPGGPAGARKASLLLHTGNILQGHEECFNPWFPAPSTPCPCRGKGSVMDPLCPCRTTAVLPPNPHPSWCSSSAICSHGIKILKQQTLRGWQGGSQFRARMQVALDALRKQHIPGSGTSPQLTLLLLVLRMKDRHSAGIPVTRPQGTKAPQENKHERLAGKI